MKPIAIVLGVLVFFILVPTTCVVGWGCRIFNDAAETAYSQVNPKELLRKYEWFKDSAAQLDKKQADIEVYNQRLRSLVKSYGDQPRKDWAREDREQSNLWESESAGVKASYNSLAAEYNAAMSKMNWAFCEVGNLPQGASVPLPREFKPYEEK